MQSDLGPPILGPPNQGFCPTPFTSDSPSDSPSVEPEICYCAPNSYEFILDFSLACPPDNSTLGGALTQTFCRVHPFNSTSYDNSFVNPAVTDFVPVSVQSIDIYELNQNESVIVSEAIEGDFKDGDTFSFISGVSTIQKKIPKAIQLNIHGRNKDGEELFQVYQITFTNGCGAFPHPVLSDGQSVGWTRFVSIFYIAKECGLSYLVLIS